MATAVRSRHFLEIVDVAGEKGEAPSSTELNPSKIAQDFILQYYSVRARYPESLYRFYRDDSILTMGCHQEERIVQGKTAIAEHFASLDYHNCNSSVAAFNAQFVLPTCITIMISGEMSNNDDISRRYCEVFSLIRYDVDRFYVKSHMFHFQDDAFSDNAVSAASASDQYVSAATTTSPQKMENGYSSHDASATGYSHHAPVANVYGEGSLRETSNISQQVAEQIGHDHNVELDTRPESRTHQESSIGVTPENAHESIIYSSHPYNGVDDTSTWPRHDATTEHVETVDETNVSHPPSTNGSSAVPNTWARIASSGQANSPIQQRQETRSAMPVQQYEKVPPHVVNAEESTISQHEHNTRTSNGRPRAAPALNGHRSTQYNSNEARKSVATGRELFVGNLPHDCVELELREFFEQFGAVSFLKINKGKSNLPNYGFVDMESVDAVQEILKRKPLLIRSTHRINVEEKNASRPSGGYGGQGPFVNSTSGPRGGHYVSGQR